MAFAETSKPSGLIDQIDLRFPKTDLKARLSTISELFDAPVFTTSLGKEDQVIISDIDKDSAIRIVTLNTGRLFEETKELLAETRQRYGLEIEEFHPDEAALKEYAEKSGLNGFYDSVDARHACCHIRKIEPLKRALKGADAWITGLRRGQSQNRTDVPFAEWDEANQLVKINVIADWSLAQLDDFIATNNVPINQLHQRGFPSIGCEPCTRAIKPGEDERAGRWWWERDDSRECGLHVANIAKEQSNDVGETQR